VILQVETQTFAPAARSDPGPRPVGPEGPGVGLVAQRVVEDLGQPLLISRVVDGHDHLDPSVQVPLHQIG
jgi:hypothetical protein